LIKHLLILREQIAPFEMSFISTEKSLDFSSTSGLLPSQSRQSVVWLLNGCPGRGSRSSSAHSAVVVLAVSKQQ
jgi:hypothetical protein